MKLCDCGCGEQVTKETNRYINGHASRGKKRPYMMGENNPAKRPEVREKLKGKNNPNYGKKERPWLDGNNHPMRKRENRMKVSLKLKGRKHEWQVGDKNPMKKLKHRMACSKRMMGENNPAWKGGIECEPYCQVWSDKEYKESIKERDGHQCLNPDCNHTSIRLCLHHIDYDKKNCHPNNLITVCRSCNTRANFNREWHTAWYQAIIYNRYERRING